MQTKVYEEYAFCRLCPRQCCVDRRTETGACGMGDTLILARAALHFGEEPCFGKAGAVFFSGCSLSCVYCQNHEISRDCFGRPGTAEGLADVFLSLEREGADTLDLVTPTHFRPHITRALSLSKEKGLSLPVVYNTSGYENADAIAALRGTVDVFLPDYKYHSPRLARDYSHAPDYPKVAFAAIGEMLSVTGAPDFDARGILRRGTVVRLLCLPGALIDAKARLRSLYRTYGDTVVYSLLRQYTPPAGMKPPLDRTVSDAEYVSLVREAQSLGVRYAYTQERESQGSAYLPLFDGTGVPG